MSTRVTIAVGSAVGCAVVVGLLAGAVKRPSARLQDLVRSPSGMPVQQEAGTVAGRASSAARQAITRVSARRGARDVASGGAPATAGSVIPLETVPIDELSEWELDLLTTPDP